MAGSVRSVESLVTPALVETVAALAAAGVDAAAVRLAERYAKALDEAAGMEAAAARVLRAVEADGDPDLVEQVAALKRRVAAEAILEQVGPRFLAVLEQLGATPKGRARLPKGGSPGGGQLHALRSSRGA